MTDHHGCHAKEGGRADLSNLAWKISIHTQGCHLRAYIWPNSLDHTDLPCNMQYFPRISPNSLKISLKY